MEYVIGIPFLLLALFVFKNFLFRAKSINCAINALKQTVEALPVDSTPSPRVIKSKLARKYYDLSHRAQSNDIRDYATKLLSIQKPKPEHIAMLLLMSLSTDLKQEQLSTKAQVLGDIAKWCELGHDYLVEREKLNYLGT